MEGSWSQWSIGREKHGHDPVSVESLSKKHGVVIVSLGWHGHKGKTMPCARRGFLHVFVWKEGRVKGWLFNEGD